MNVFEDLVVELKEENLLEETIVDRALGLSDDDGNGHHENGNGHHDTEATADFFPSIISEEEPEPEADFALVTEPEIVASTPRRKAVTPEFVRGRLSARISALELTDHVISAVEKKKGKAQSSFDDLAVKKAFHVFSQACSEPDSAEYADAESAMVASLDTWEEKLQGRDANLPVASFRSYVESANPPLSPHALFAMIRFYRASPYSDLVLAKFDFLATRLFSKFVDGERRELLCPRSEIVKYLKKKYAEWGTPSADRSEAGDEEVAALAQSFDELIKEAEQSLNLFDLVQAGFFDRLSLFKKGAASMMFIPEVAAAAIDSNIRTATKMIDLITVESQNLSGGALKAKYASADSSVISEAIGRSFGLGSAAGKAAEEARVEQRRQAEAVQHKTETRPKIEQKASKPKKAKAARRSALFGVNKWLLVVTILTALLSGGIYVWAEYFATEPTSNAGVKTVNFEQPDIKDLVRVAKVSSNTLHAIVNQNYEQLKEDEKRQFLDRLRRSGEQYGYTRVTLINGAGKNVGYASPEKIEIPGGK